MQVVKKIEKCPEWCKAMVPQQPEKKFMAIMRTRETRMNGTGGTK